MQNKSQYKSAAEWRKHDYSAYIQAKNGGHMDDICDHFGWSRMKAHVPPNYWDNKKLCLDEARKHKNISEWSKSSYSCWEMSKKRGWFDECISHMKVMKKPSGFWENKENCLASARKHTSVKVWYKDDYGAWENAKKFGWFDECISHMNLTGKLIGHWEDKENVLVSARKYSTKTEWRDNEAGAVVSAKKFGWFDECISHMKVMKKKWTKELVFEESKKHKTRSQWNEVSTTSYQSAKKNGWFDECTKHMVSSKRPSNYWTKDTVLAEAKKYTTRSRWSKRQGSSYNMARNKGWLEECTKHMK